MQEINYDKSYLFRHEHGAGSKSAIDDIIDEEAIIEHDGRSTARTFYYVEEAPEHKRKQFKRMLQHQEDMYHPSRSRAGANFRADMERTAKTFCSQCELNSYQTERVLHVMDDLDVNSYGHYSTEKVILAVISLVANEDQRLIRDEPEYRDLVEQVGMTLEEVRKVRLMTRERTDAFD